MLNVDKLCASAESCLGWPCASPGSNDIWDERKEVKVIHAERG